MNRKTYISTLFLIFIGLNIFAQTGSRYMGDYDIKESDSTKIETLLYLGPIPEPEKHSNDRAPWNNDISLSVPQAVVNTNFAVGTTTGIADVSSTGGATYQIPIQVPQGVVGFEPSVTINYNSQTGVGLMGYGWNLSAFSSISRGGKTFYHDNAAESPQMTSTDNVMLDGQRLLLISGTNLVNGAKYRMEYDPYTDVTFKTIGSYAGFVVRTKDGTVKEFGATSNSNITVSGTTLLWLLSKVTDKNGNTITYEYETVANNGEFYLTKIQYATNRSIQFSYETRQDKQKTYFAGVAINSNKRLKSISTYINQTLINQYQFNYTYDGFYSKLNEVIENGQSGMRYNSTTVDYGYSTIGYKEEFIPLSEKREGNLPLWADFNGDGRMDFLSYPEKSSYTNSDVATLFLNTDVYGITFRKKCTIPLSTDFAGLFLADLNGDGKTDVVRITTAPNGTYRYNYYMFNGENFVYDYQGFNTNGKEVLVGDFNGDGRHEILVIDDKNQKVFNYQGTEIASGGVDNWGTAYIKGYYPNNRYLYDLTGNGKANILVMNNSSGWVYELNGKSFERVPGYNTTEIRNSYFPYFGDFNGDGKIDILIQNNSNFNDVSILYSTGKGFVKQNVSDTNIRAKVFVGDFNKDGKCDIFHLEPVGNTIQMKVGIYNGSGFSTKQYTARSLQPDMFPVTGLYDNYLYQVGDFDGDGRAEFCFARYADTYIMEFLPDEQTLLAKTITDGLGARTSFEYAPISATGICSNTGSNPVFPLVSSLFPLYVVRTMYQSGGGYNDNIIYSYKNPKIHVQGKGFLGFEEITAESSYKDRKAITKYGFIAGYYYPYLTEHKVTTRTGGAISTSTFQYTYTTQGSKRIAPYLRKQTETDHLTNITRTVDVTSVDTWGTPLRVTTQYGNDVTESVVNTYYNSQTDNLWVFSLPLTTEKTITKAGSSWVEKQVFVYNAKALPAKLTTYTNGTRQVLEENYIYDTFGNATSSSSKAFSSANVLTTTYKYSTDGVYQTEMTDPLNRKYSWTYNASGRLATSVDPLNKTTTYTYDGMGRLTNTTYPDGTVSATSYTWQSPFANSLYCVTETQTGQPTVKTYFDAHNRQLRQSTTRFDNTEVLYDKKYDTAGRLSQESLPFKGSTASAWNTYTYDTYGRLTRVAYASGKVDTYAYSNRTVTTTSDGIAIQRTTNAKGELISVTDPAGTITYNLRPDGLPNSVTAPGNIVTTFGYDEYGRQNQIVDPSAGTKKFVYDADGNLKEETDANNRKKTMLYDKYGRITSKQLPEFTTTYSYNAQGFLASESSNNGTSHTYTYDQFGRLSTDRDNAPDNRWLEKTYTYSGGNLSTIAYTSHAGAIATETYVYSYGHLSEIKVGATSIWKLNQENAIGLPTSAVTGPVSRSYTYNTYGVPTGRSASTSSSGTIQNFSYNFDISKGNLTSRTDSRRGIQESFTYDNLNRLKTYYGGSMEYDAKGNITKKNDVGSAFQYSLTSKPYAITRVQVGDNTAIARRTQSVTYTSFERPATISENLYEATFTYDGNGDRKKMQLKRNTLNQWQRYYLGGRYEAEYGTTNKQILYLGGDAYSAPAAYVNEGSSWAFYYICRDYLGSITHVINSNGSIKNELSYDSWGRMRSVSNYGTIYATDGQPSLFLNRGYTGHEHLNNFGLINANARLYDPSLGRFLSPDPYVQAVDFSQSFNRYSYCVNNPLRFVDPDGEIAWFIPLIAAAIGGTTNLIANWKNVNGFWQGLTTFGVGAGAGLATAVTAGTGSALGVVGVATASSALTGANNSIVAQTGTNFSGFNNIDWRQVGINSAVNGAAGLAGSSVGIWAANSSWVVNGISHPLVKSTVISPLAAGAGHIAGGTTAGLLQGHNLSEAFTNSFKGIGQTMALGGGLGVASTAGMLYANGINPLTGNRLSLRPLEFGSTGRTTPHNLSEQLAMKEIMSNPEMGKVIMRGMKDTRWLGWSKMQYVHHGLDGTTTTIHYVGKWHNGRLISIDDFKFK